MAAECDFVDKYARIDLHAYFLLPESGSWNRFYRVLIKYKRKISACCKKIKCKAARKCEKESKMSEQQKYSNVTKDYLCRFYEILSDMIKGMTEAELTCSISHNFIVQMIPHHMAAIKMSENILKYTTWIEVQEIAENIIVSQTKSIENMEKALAKCSELKNSENDLCLYGHNFDMITNTMFTEMHDAPAVNNVNADFMREMIPHHQGAIRMSENALRFEICSELIPILDAIIISQREGVREMERLLSTMCSTACGE